MGPCQGIGQQKLTLARLSQIRKSFPDPVSALVILHEPCNLGNEHGRWDKKCLPQQRADKATSDEPHDCTTELGFGHFAGDNVVGHHRQMRINEGKHEYRGDTIDDGRKCARRDAQLWIEAPGIERGENADCPKRNCQDVGPDNPGGNALPGTKARDVADSRQACGISHVPDATFEEAVHQQARKRSMDLEVRYRHSKEALKHGYQERTDQSGQGR